MQHVKGYGNSQIYTKLIDKLIKHPEATLENDKGKAIWQLRFNEKEKNYDTNASYFKFIKLKKIFHFIRISLNTIGFYKNYKKGFDNAVKVIATLARQSDILTQQASDRSNNPIERRGLNVKLSRDGSRNSLVQEKLSSHKAGEESHSLASIEDYDVEAKEGEELSSHQAGKEPFSPSSPEDHDVEAREEEELPKHAAKEMDFSHEVKGDFEQESSDFLPYSSASGSAKKLAANQQDEEETNGLEKKSYDPERFIMSTVMNRQTIPSIILNPLGAVGQILKKLKNHQKFVGAKFSPYLKQKPFEITKRIDALDRKWQKQVREPRLLSIDKAFKLINNEWFVSNFILPIPGIIEFFKTVNLQEFLNADPSRLAGVLFPKVKDSRGFYVIDFPENHQLSELERSLSYNLLPFVREQLSMFQNATNFAHLDYKDLIAAKNYMKVIRLVLKGSYLVPKILQIKVIAGFAKLQLEGFLKSSLEADQFVVIKNEVFWFVEKIIKGFFDIHTPDALIILYDKWSEPFITLGDALEKKNHFYLKRIKNLSASSREHQIFKNELRQLLNCTIDNYKAVFKEVIDFFQKQLQLARQNPIEEELIESALNHIKGFEWAEDSYDVLGQTWDKLMVPLLSSFFMPSTTGQ